MKKDLIIYKNAPLPFIGQKRQFLTHYTEILNQYISGDGQGWTIIDAFGGSGLLSDVAKRIKPAARVIYNDFDNYAERLLHIDEINELRLKISDTIGNTIPKNKKLTPDVKSKAINVIQSFQGYKDLNCLASWLLFSGNQVGSLEDLFNKDFWHCVRQSDYPRADGYLDGIEIIQESFHQLLPKFRDEPNTLFVLDPPYLCTRQESYRQASYFDLIGFLRLIHLTRPPYIFFSSSKSEFVRFIDAMVEDKWDNWQAFENYGKISINTSASYSGKYEDNMVFKF
ncbi:hypothetical protein RZ60_05825 [[Haemophilus] ducreyi]|uniref:D12 class N6 adenine-specific DNA methyltransferase n=1 Tax=Haemophilus ducreyi TaxID=730 RepID=A0AAC8UDJ9_HAEDC|nr:hypothetical protein [[Haemophilus] ducreyi]AKO31626.1 hypothetical protein RY60_06020 [[Haemophilus] ducreyi]AKO33083.1 hypothetical protein RZ57_06085 [[Haemophilus] ducreyi]AKO34532.1 hypothetical protein RZ58_06080 [[Haemophilus] ducreyi]AKO35968.1 hypothetical protein RZ59_06010 [[Haemophilus] ducreyi]AKO44727.1 hypothetical protein RZ60_05825 [[Haemophilus] ducreyi]